MSNKYEATGTVHSVNPSETRGNFTFRKFVVELADNPKYPQLVEFQASGKSMDYLDALKPGDGVKVSFDLRGREWTSPNGEVRFFVTLSAWRIDALTAAAERPASTASTAPTGGGPDDSLPF